MATLTPFQKKKIRKQWYLNHKNAILSCENQTVHSCDIYTLYSNNQLKMDREINFSKNFF